MSNIKLLLFFSFFVSFLFGLLNGIVMTQLIRFLALLILFWTYPLKFKLNRNHLILLLLVGAYLIAMQVGRALGISSIDNFISSNYPNEGKLFIETQYDNVGGLFTGFDNRLAGICSNANIMGQSMLILYAIVIIGLRKNFSGLFVLFVYSTFFLSILFTGGRSGLLVFIIMNGFIFWRQIMQRKLLLISIFIALGFILIYFDYLFDFRAFDIISLFNHKGSSGSIKIQIFVDYLREISSGSIMSSVMFFFGSLNWDRQFDAELGNIISFFGITGFMLIIYFFIRVYKSTYKIYRFVFSIFLLSIGGTIVINYRYSILMFLILSSVFQKYILDQDEKNSLFRTSSKS